MRRRVWIIALLMAALTSLPYLVAVFSAPPGTHFSGVILNPVDYNSHLAKMQQGAHGEWLYQLLFSPEPHQPILLQTFYVALGHVVRWTGLSFDLVFHLARVLCTILMVFAIWAFMSHFLNQTAACWALLLSLFAVGTSYIILLIAPNLFPGISPIEFWLYDAYTFMSAFIAPHFAAGIALLALSFLSMDRWIVGIEKAGRSTPSLPRDSLILWIATFGLAIVQPFDLLLVDIVLGAVIVWRVYQRQIKLYHVTLAVGLIGITHLIVLGYDALAFQLPVWNYFSAQNITQSPPIIFYLLGYALVLIPAMLGITAMLRRCEERLLIPALWLIVVAILAYAPLQTQRRYLLGVQVPMATLAVYWITTSAIPALRLGQRSKSITLLYGAVVSISTIVILDWLIMNTSRSSLYIPDTTEQAWQWIRNNTPQDSIFISGFTNGGQIAARTGRHVVLGHWIETAEYEAKLAGVSSFFSTAADNWRKSFADALGVDYIWYSAEEKGQWNPNNADWLEKVYQVNGITIYRVCQCDVI